MPVVHVRADRTDFAQTLSAMREWLDRNNRRLERFETEAGADGGIIVKVQFADALAAELFRLELRRLSLGAGGVRQPCQLVGCRWQSPA